MQRRGSKGRRKKKMRNRQRERGRGRRQGGREEEWEGRAEEGVRTQLVYICDLFSSEHTTRPKGQR